MANLQTNYVSGNDENGTSTKIVNAGFLFYGEFW